MLKFYNDVKLGKEIYPWNSKWPISPTLKLADIM
jgi:hypothetical protein